MKNTITKWIVILVLAVIVYFVMSKAVYMIIDGNNTGNTILYVVAALAAANIYDAVKKALTKQG